MDDLLTLVRQDTGAEFRWAASTNGGENKGPCPICGGTNRFIVWPNHPDGKARFLCPDEGRNGCGIHGDMADYLQVVRRMGKKRALEAMGIGSFTGNVKVKKRMNKTSKVKLIPATKKTIL